MAALLVGSLACSKQFTASAIEQAAGRASPAASCWSCRRGSRQRCAPAASSPATPSTLPMSTRCGPPPQRVSDNCSNLTHRIEDGEAASFNRAAHRVVLLPLRADTGAVSHLLRSVARPQLQLLSASHVRLSSHGGRPCILTDLAHPHLRCVAGGVCCGFHRHDAGEGGGRPAQLQLQEGSWVRSSDNPPLLTAVALLHNGSRIICCGPLPRHSGYEVLHHLH